MATATSSPVLTNNVTVTTNGPVTPTHHMPSLSPAVTGARSPSIPNLPVQRSEPPKNLRGLNKPKCITCGNVARSRCPFKCCKSCCSKAQNPCHIHVLKPNATLADRAAPANSTTPEQQPSEAPPPVVDYRPSAKVNSIRQSTFAQYNNAHIPRSRKPLSRKDALVINEWRSAKLKEYKESHIEAENEAFDRYMQNVSLLEEVFDMMSERPEEDGSEMANLPTTSCEKAQAVSEIKAKIRSNPVRIDVFRKRVRQTVDEGLRNCQMYGSKDGSNGVDNEGDMSPSATKNWWDGKTSALIELNDKLNRARTEEDLKACMQMRYKIKGQAKSTPQKAESTDTSNEHHAPPDSALVELGASPLKLVRPIGIDQDALNSMNSYLSSLEEIEDL